MYSIKSFVYKLPYKLPKSETLEKSENYLETRLSAQSPIREKDLKAVTIKNFTKRDIVGNKAKGQMSKLVFQKNKARQIFRKMDNSYLPSFYM